MSNQDPDSIPEQIRHNRPFILVLALAILVAVGGFLFVLSLDTESKDIERNAPPPAATVPEAPIPDAAPAQVPAQAPAQTAAPETPAAE